MVYFLLLNRLHYHQVPVLKCINIYLLPDVHFAWSLGCYQRNLVTLLMIFYTQQDTDMFSEHLSVNTTF